MITLLLLTYVALNQAIGVALLFRELHACGCWYKAGLGRQNCEAWWMYVLVPCGIYAFASLMIFWLGLKEAWS